MKQTKGIINNSHNKKLINNLSIKKVILILINNRKKVFKITIKIAII